MIAKCANPTCNREFRELSKGRLFIRSRRTVMPDDDPDGKPMRLIDYCYWLCPECEATNTITRHESQVSVTARRPGTLQIPPPAPEILAKGGRPRC